MRSQFIWGFSTFCLWMGLAQAVSFTSAELKTFETKYAKGLPPKNEGTEAVWGSALELIRQFNSKKLMTLVLKHEPQSGMPTAWYRYDLLKLMETNNQLLLQTAEGLSKNKNCLLHWLLPENQLVEKSTVLELLQKNPSRESQAFQKAIQANTSGRYPRVGC